MKPLVTAALLTAFAALAGCGSAAAVHAASAHPAAPSPLPPTPAPATTECDYAVGNNYAADSGADPEDVPALMVILITDSSGGTYQCTNADAGFVPVAGIGNMGKEEFELSDGPAVNVTVTDTVDMEEETGNQVCGANAQQDVNPDAKVTVTVYDTGQSDLSSIYAQAICKVGLGVPEQDITP